MRIYCETRRSGLVFQLTFPFFFFRRSLLGGVQLIFRMADTVFNAKISAEYDGVANFSIDGLLLCFVGNQQEVTNSVIFSYEETCFNGISVGKFNAKHVAAPVRAQLIFKMSDNVFHAKFTAETTRQLSQFFNSLSFSLFSQRSLLTVAK